MVQYNIASYVVGGGWIGITNADVPCLTHVSMWRVHLHRRAASVVALSPNAASAPVPIAGISQCPRLARHTAGRHPGGQWLGCSLVIWSRDLTILLETVTCTR